MRVARVKAFAANAFNTIYHITKCPAVFSRRRPKKLITVPEIILFPFIEVNDKY